MKSSDCFRLAMSRIKLALIMPWRENKGVCQFKRILDGCFLVARAQEIFCGNLFLDVASQEIF